MAMFSATCPGSGAYYQDVFASPHGVKVGDMVSSKNTRIKQIVRYITEAQKSNAVDILRRLGRDGKAIVFVNAKKQADLVGNALEEVALDSLCCMEGRAKTSVTLQAFRDNAIRVLVATDGRTRFRYQRYHHGFEL